MTEEFLHYIWKHALFDRSLLETTDGKKIEIVQLGQHNHDSGPDFFNAKLKIGDTLWAGNVEIHIHSSDWNAHKHQYDKAYKNVILHVVWENDAEFSLPGGYSVHTLELKKLIPKNIFSKYEEFKNSAKRIPCENDIHLVSELVIHSWMDRLVAERLERKTNTVDIKLKATVNDWEETFYQTLLRNLGNPINKHCPIKQLAGIAPMVLKLKPSCLARRGYWKATLKMSMLKNCKRNTNTCNINMALLLFQKQS
jgi:hypothetical protein